jgi:hypothetical protein
LSYSKLTGKTIDATSDEALDKSFKNAVGLSFLA